MNFIVSRIKWLLLVSGALTCTMVYAAVAPEAALESMFGTTLGGPAAEVVVRNWGALIALVGAMLIYAAFRPEVRTLVVAVAGIGKLIFIGLVLAYGRGFLSHQAGIAVGFDLVMVALYAAYLLGIHRVRPN
jgi:hypothetical protein